MPEVKVPDDPSPQTILDWIAKTYSMSNADLARMFQRSDSTIHEWRTSGKISHRNLMKVRMSYFYLNNVKDPHGQERKCVKCKRWLSLSEFREGKTICQACESSKITVKITDEKHSPRKKQLTRKKT